MATISKDARTEAIGKVVPDGRKRLRPKDIRDQYGISLTPIYQAIYRGELRAQRFQQRIWLIRPEDAEEWVERFSTPNAA